MAVVSEVLLRVYKRKSAKKYLHCPFQTPYKLDHVAIVIVSMRTNIVLASES